MHLSDQSSGLDETVGARIAKRLSLEEKMATKKTTAKGSSKTSAKSAGKTTSAKKAPGKKSAPSKKASSKSSSHSSMQLTDHDEIQQWAEARDAKPSCVKNTGGKGDVGMIRLDFPGYSGADSLQEITWDEWFESFDENNLALLVQETTASGETSNFNKLVKRTGKESAPKTRGAH